MKKLGIALAVTLMATDAQAQWTRVDDIPVANVYSVFTNGDTIAVGSDGNAFVSVNGGATWIPSAPIVPDTIAVEDVVVRNGKVYAGTFGLGAFVSATSARAGRTSTRDWLAASSIPKKGSWTCACAGTACSPRPAARARGCAT
jgi:hypothetical protein